ncbi:acetyltransferase [Niabella ginsenosidivorans]|uniref:Acetyltransferase n=1 Tax=Niabella ginsenosidivorans TaxID=1176587 RepID=A0A1A9I1H2_9BACT|nr:GNAT family N-acetyltransferase [Niabella ginsenosidivorans]ANH81373.1 acetyltransferase [Niabella ginsenosidivorans]
MHIRQIQSGEAIQVVRLFDQYRMFYKQASDIALAQRFLEERLNNNESVIFAAFAEVNGTEHAAGFTQLYPKYSSMRASKNWILNDLFVEGAFRKNGIGAALIQRAIAFARENGATFIQLETAYDNSTAQRLYEQTGFRQQPPETEFIVYRYALV